MSKLMLWGLEASQHEQSRPHLVERDKDRVLTAFRYAGVSPDTAYRRTISKGRPSPS